MCVVYVWEIYLHLCECAHGCQRGCLGSFSITLPDSHFFIELGARFPDNKVQKSSCAYPLSTVLGLQAPVFTPGFLCGFWGFELKFSCLCSRHSYLFSSPSSFHYVSRKWIAGSHVNSVFCFLKDSLVFCIGAKKFYMLTNFLLSSLICEKRFHLFPRPTACF